MASETVQKALIFGSASLIGAALMDTMEASGYQVEAGHAHSDVLAADVVVCIAYGKDAVRSSPPEAQPPSNCLKIEPCRCVAQGELQRTERVLSELVDADLTLPKSLILISSVMTWARTPVELVRLPCSAAILAAKPHSDAGIGVRTETEKTRNAWLFRMRISRSGALIPRTKPICLANGR